MHDIISSGKALYWGTSEWPADDIRAAIEIAERHHLHKPVTEQSQYNLLGGTKVEDEYARIIEDYGYGNTLEPARVRAAHRQVPRRDSRRLPRHAPRLRVAGGNARRPDAVGRVERLRPIADRLGCSIAQLASRGAPRTPTCRA